jgi:hypothetical protein
VVPAPETNSGSNPGRVLVAPSFRGETILEAELEAALEAESRNRREECRAVETRYKRPLNGTSLHQRGPDGKLLPGNALDREGRPRGAVGFGGRIRKETLVGRELISAALALARDPNHKDCMRAIEFLAERAFGKALEASTEDEGILERSLASPQPTGSSGNSERKLQLVASSSMLGGGLALGVAVLRLIE